MQRVYVFSVYSPPLWNFSNPMINCEREENINEDPEAIVSMYVMS